MRVFPAAALTARAPRILPNAWDFLAVPLVVGLIALVAEAGRNVALPLEALNTPGVLLDPLNLPGYALRTTIRMLLALAASLVFTLTYGTLAAKSRRAERVLVPLLDILQSVPVLGYISFTVAFFMSLFPGRIAGAELAAIFAIFTAQAWNMAFSFYQSLRTVPRDLEEACRGFRFSGWQRFWRLDVPFAMPGLVWNMMMSMSGAWFFVVASEAITVGDRTVTLPGIGAYVALAIKERNLAAVGWVILAMIVVIALYDQLMFRPLVSWADRFRFEQTGGGEVPRSWVRQLFRRARLTRALGQPVRGLSRWFLRLRIGVAPRWDRPAGVSSGGAADRLLGVAWYGAVGLAVAYGLWVMVSFVAAHVGWGELLIAFKLGFYTMIRIIVLIAIASLIWVPLSVMIGLRPKLAEFVQPFAQFMAAFPANLLFPIAVVLILKFQLNPGIWLSPLMILGTQWYIVFNVIAGATVFPNDFKEAAANFHMRGWMWWRKVMLPGVFSYFVTGGITASGGAWNASIVAEAVSWGDTKLRAAGLGAYIADATNAGDYARIVLGCAVMSVYVLLFNRLVWRPMYSFAERRLRLN